MIDLSIIIVSFNTKDLTLKCLESILNKEWKIKYEVWVVDNASRDGTILSIQELFPQVHLIINQDNQGFAKANNLALEKIKARFVLLLNSDTEVFDSALDNLTDFMDQGGFGIGSCRLVNSDGSFQPNGGDLPSWLPLLIWIAGLDDILLPIRESLPSFHRQFESYYHHNVEIGWVSGSVMVISKEVIDKIGLLDDSIFMYGEDVEYCLRARQHGFNVGWTNNAEIKHLGGGSSKDSSLKQWIGEFRGLLYIYKKHYNILRQWLLKLFIYLFVILRIMAFLVMGKFQISKTYAKILINI